MAKKVVARFKGYRSERRTLMSSERSTNMVLHDCFGEQCPCQSLFSGSYCVCDINGRYAPMKRIENTWAFFPLEGSSLVFNYEVAKCYHKREDALEFIEQYSTDV